MNKSYSGYLKKKQEIIGWYGIGLFAAGWTLNDAIYVNKNVDLALKPGWIVIIIIFSIIGFWRISKAADRRELRIYPEKMQ